MAEEAPVAKHVPSWAAVTTPAFEQSVTAVRCRAKDRRGTTHVKVAGAVGYAHPGGAIGRGRGVCEGVIGDGGAGVRAIGRGIGCLRVLNRGREGGGDAWRRR